MRRFVRFRCASALTASVVTIAACGSKAATPTQPTQTPPPTPQTQTLAAPTVSAPVNDAQLTAAAVVLRAGNAQATGVENVRYRFEWSEISTFPEGSGTGFKEDVEQGGDGTSLQITDTLRPGVKYFWRVRAYSGDVTSDWSATASFVTLNKGYIRGQEIYDPLVNGETVGARIGGTFVPNQGWKATTPSDGIDYDIPTCSACTVEFDVTDFGKKAGAALSKDLKWLSMGDASTWSSFTVFRNHPWKMHLEQRADGDGTGMKLIWRTAGHSDDNDTKLMSTSMNWRQTGVFHFVITWDRAGYSITIGEIQNGRLVGNREWFSGDFARVYAPPNHRISLGTRSRSETIPGVFRNVRIYPGPPRSR